MTSKKGETKSTIKIIYIWPGKFFLFINILEIGRYVYVSKIYFDNQNKLSETIILGSLNLVGPKFFFFFFCLCDHNREKESEK